MHFDIDSHLIFETVLGSHAYGTNTEKSDVDLRGVCIPPQEVALSLFKKFDQFEDKENDRVIFSLAKFFKLARDCNPSILELLFVDQKMWKMCTGEWRVIIENREMFLSKRIRHSFAGYAASQLKRMRTHVQWMAKAPKEPKPEYYGVEHKMFLGNNEIGAFDYLEEHGIEFTKEIVELMSKVKAYKHAVNDYNNYQTWKKERNSSRAELEKKYGYDTKHAMHLVRLSLQGEELLMTGEMVVCDRPDKDMLVEVRDGGWSYEKLLEFAEDIDKRMEVAADKSLLPDSPNEAEIDNLYLDLVFNICL